MEKYTKLDYEKSFVTVNNEYKFNIPFNTLFEVYNSLAAFTVCSLIKLNLDEACNTISNMDPNLKIFNKYTINDKDITSVPNISVFKNGKLDDIYFIDVDRYSMEKIISYLVLNGE